MDVFYVLKYLYYVSVYYITHIYHLLHKNIVFGEIA